jgi:tetratricopeptide (TPR) repeat protein
MLSNQWEDLDKAIIHLTESILFHPHSWLEHGPRILQALFLLALALVKRSRVYRLPGDAIYAANYLRYLRNQPHQAFGIPRHKVTVLLVDALAIQVEWEARNVMQNIGEMAALSRELLTLDMSDVNTTRSFFLFLTTLLSKLHLPVPHQPMEQVIECLRAATEPQIFRLEARLTLSFCLGTRYVRTFVNDDYEEASSILDEAITLSPQDNFLAQLPIQQIVTMLAIGRSMIHLTPEYSEESMYRARAFLDSPIETNAAHSLASYSLENATWQRFRCFGSIDGPEGSARNLQLVTRSIEGLHPMFDQILKMGEIVKGLVYRIRNNNISDIEDAIKVGRTTLLSSVPKDTVTPFPSHLFGKVLFEAFVRTKKIEYLNESISARRQDLELPLLPLLPPLRLDMLYDLSLNLFTRSRFFPDHNTQDLDEALELLSQCVDNKHGSLPVRCRLACQWASIARRALHPSISRAYESAVSLIQNTLLFAPTLQQQHATLTLSVDLHRMSLDYASYQVGLHQLEEAVVTLERGRALLWSEMRDLRISIDKLLQTDPQLGQKFAAVNQELEELTKSIPPSSDLNTDEHRADHIRAVDPFGRLLVKQRRLLKEREDLISQIQALPGFDNFLTSLSFDTIRSATSSGPVIIINHSEWRSDIIILLQNAPPSLIPTPADFFSRASALKDELLDARNKHGPDSNHYNQTLAHILAKLYDLVGKSVIDRLRQLKVPEQSRVWWCPTSVFCSLPLHAMGPIPSDEGEDRYFLDLYIPSYTPTLSALIPESNNSNPGSPSSGLPSLLLVANFDVPSPDVSLSEVCEDVKVVQALKKRLPVKSLISEGATPISVLGGLCDHQLVHFVCHGILEARKPFNAGFELYGSERLTLLDLVRSHLPTAEFAFLSACHTAELTEGSSADEGLHLAAAMQYCGFRSVVGTMWAMANEDGPDVAKYFYQSMFPKKENGEPAPYYKRSAGALRDAVRKLQKKRGMTLERWVNFVHYGA